MAEDRHEGPHYCLEYLWQLSPQQALNPVLQPVSMPGAAHDEPDAGQKSDDYGSQYGADGSPGAVNGGPGDVTGERVRQSAGGLGGGRCGGLRDEIRNSAGGDGQAIAALGISGRQISGCNAAAGGLCC